LLFRGENPPPSSLEGKSVGTNKQKEKKKDAPVSGRRAKGKKSVPFPRTRSWIVQRGKKVAERPLDGENREGEISFRQ